MTADGDVYIYGPAPPNAIAALVTAGAHVVADDYTMCSYGAGMVVVMVISAT